MNKSRDNYFLLVLPTRTCRVTPTNFLPRLDFEFVMFTFPERKFILVSNLHKKHRFKVVLAKTKTQKPGYKENNWKQRTTMHSIKLKNLTFWHNFLWLHSAQMKWSLTRAKMICDLRLFTIYVVRTWLKILQTFSAIPQTRYSSVAIFIKIHHMKSYREQNINLRECFPVLFPMHQVLGCMSVFSCSFCQGF